MTEKWPLNLLNARDLIAQSNLHNEIDADVLTRGLKAQLPENTDEERALIKSYQDDLRKILSMERIALKNDRSIASYEAGRIRLVKCRGHWDPFESSGQIDSFVEPHEALFMIEMNRLKIYMGKAIVSLEKAYHLFLSHDTNNKQTCDKLNKYEYLVYSHFMRFGCNLRRFKNNDYSSDRQFTSSDCESVNDTETTSTDDKSYVWNYLNELLGHRRRIIERRNVDFNRYDAIKMSMNGIIDGFKDVNPGQSSSAGCSSETSTESKAPMKRKWPDIDDSDDAVPALKVTKLSHKVYADDQYHGSGSTNDFMIGYAFQRFKHIFDQIDMIDLKSSNDNFDCDRPITEKFSFDLWTSMDYSQYKFKGPTFRLIIKQPSKSLPSNDDIFRLYQSLSYKSAIVVVSINEEMSFQAYIYRFTS